MFSMLIYILGMCVHVSLVVYNNSIHGYHGYQFPFIQGTVFMLCQLVRLAAKRLSSLLQYPPRCTLHTQAVLCYMELRSIVAKLEEIAPTSAAQEWDNVGLLVEPSRKQLIERIFVTNDLTEEVLDEVETVSGKEVGLIISYHPPIFAPFKRLTQASAKERIILRCVSSGRAIYSPHTSLDKMINKWLLSGLGEGEITSFSSSSETLVGPIWKIQGHNKMQSFLNQTHT